MLNNIIELFSDEKAGKQVIDSLPIAVYATDTEGRLQYFNPAAAELPGREPEIGTDQWCVSRKLYYPDGTPMPYDESPLAVAMKENQSIKGVEAVAECSNGKRIRFKAYPSPLHNEKGEMIGGINVLMDIADQKEKEAELKDAIAGSEQQKRLYEAIVSSTPDLIYVIDLNYRFLYANDSLVELMGGTREEIIGKGFREFEDKPGNPERYEQEIDQVISTKKPVQGEVFLLHDKFGKRFYHYIFVPVLDNRGEVEAITGTTRDITERKQAEQALRKNEEKYRTLVENFPSGAVGLFDKNLRYTAVGGELVNSLRVAPEDRIGRKVSDIYPDELVEDIEPYFRAALDGEANSFEAELYGRHFFAHTLPIKNDDREVFAGMLVVQDVTERWQAQRALRKSEEKYRTLFETMEEGFCIIKMEFDDKGEPVNFRYIETNPAFQKHAGLEVTDGDSAKEVLPHFGEDMLKRNSKVALTGEPHHKELYVDELDRWLYLSAFRVGEAGERKVAVLVQNITKRKQAQKELKAMNETLEERVEERTRSLLSYQSQLRSLASKLSMTEENQRHRLATELHDNLGQLLAIGKMKVDLLQKGPDGQVSKALNDLKEVLDDALSYARELMTDLKPPPSISNDIKASIDWVIEKLEKRGLTATLEDDGRPKPLDEEVRTTAIQCVRELLYNVIKHTVEKKALVSIQTNKDYLKLSVQDKGEGFDLENKKLTPDKGGKFGLFNVKERIDLLGGTVEIETKPGEGTKVMLNVPLAEEIEATETPEAGKGEKVNKPAASVEGEERIKVLLVDDHQMVREGLRKIIEDHDDIIAIGEAATGEEAIKLTGELCPDIVLMDINLPGIDGIEATRTIVNNKPDIRVIGLSLHNEKGVIEDMISAGASAYLTKSEAFESLIVSIRAEASAQKE